MTGPDIGCERGDSWEKSPTVDSNSSPVEDEAQPVTSDSTIADEASLLRVLIEVVARHLQCPAAPAPCTNTAGGGAAAKTEEEAEFEPEFEERVLAELYRRYRARRKLLRVMTVELRIRATSWAQRRPRRPRTS